MLSMVTACIFMNPMKNVTLSYAFLFLQFQDYELLAMLRDDPNEEDKLIQADISDNDLMRVMDRSDLVGPVGSSGSVLPLKGPGWEVVVPAKSGGNVLSSLNN